MEQFRGLKAPESSRPRRSQKPAVLRDSRILVRQFQRDSHVCAGVINAPLPFTYVLTKPMELIMSVLSWLKPATLVPAVFVAGGSLASAPVLAQDVTVLRGIPPQPTTSIDCNSPYYAQYCQSYAAWYNQYYSTYDYGDTYPYYGYGIPVGVGVGSGFFPHGGFHRGFHGSTLRGGGGFHGGGFHGGGGHGGGGRR